MALENTQCPQCGKGFRFATEHLGSKTRCKSCQAIFVIARPATVQAKPVQAKPVQAKPVQAKPVQAKPVQAKPVQAKPVQAKPVQAKPVQAKPVQAKPVPEPTPVLVASVVEAKPVGPAAMSDATSPYESFAEEVMGGESNSAASSLQRMATVSSANAMAYLNTNRRLNRSLKRRDNDWATTFIFRGVNLAIFGLLLFPIAMFGFAGDMWHITSPLAACFAVLIGFIGCVLVMIGFASKPGTAATVGIVPSILFIAGGIWVGKMYYDGKWPQPEKQIAQRNATPANLNLANVGNRNGGNQAAPFGNRSSAANDLKRLKEQQEEDRKQRQRELAQRNANRSPLQDLGFGDQRDPTEDLLAQQQKMIKEMEERQRKTMEAMRNAAKSPPTIPRVVPSRPNPADLDVNPFETNDPEPPRPNRTPDKPTANDNPFEPDDTDDNPFEPDEGVAQSDANATPFPEDFETRRAVNLSNSKFLANGIRQFGNPNNFPQKNSTNVLGANERFPKILIGDSGELMIGFVAVLSFNRVNLAPVFDQNEVATSAAKKGYALGGFEATFESDHLKVIRAIYMKIDGKKLDTSDKYFGPWFGDTNAIKDARQITTEGKPAIGIRIWGGGETQGIALIFD